MLQEVFERRKSTGSGLLASLSSGFAQTFRKIVSNSKDTLQIWQRRDKLKQKKPYFRLVCVAQKRRCLSSPFLLIGRECARP